MHRSLRLAAACALLSSLTACATITRGQHTAWEVNTNPPRAKVRTSNGYFCDSTPCSLTMPRKSEFTATITKPGYHTLEVRVTTKVSGGGGAGMAGNLLFGGIIGAGVDVTTGAMLDLTPNPLNVSLEKEEAAPVAAAVAAPPPVQAPTPTPAAAEAPAPASKAEPPATTAKCGMIPQPSSVVKYVPCGG